ncbi:MULTISPECIES: NAD(P)/FAD-dependent oxidoreductase [unclassified Enterobacter]|jgi:protoporphyrinogen oxidase|uniref:NAD(P)/FAD-dependent oxidoreductase n=1 Tax=unclassified Enterobacter TaxID=2608935 RepID=UPI0015CA7D96|nr:MULTISPECIES: NAD(P)/FAD-dependent oxidoreductase [unclassified Enterobacter]MBB3304159.1 protoporphyrinogen oxidase [Enterobacter sp. Sphag1F]NYI12736.1 protoporphyrinogen oxidase [Enterobacter sp. Sphag71]
MCNESNNQTTSVYDVVIIGAGFTGLSVAYELTKQRKNLKIAIVEAQNDIGGLASAFDVGGNKLDRFYHHWFTNDEYVMELVSELGCLDKVKINPSNTGIFFANNFFKLSTPFDLLKFKPLNMINRIRLGLLALRARRVKNWHELETLSASEWLCSLGGKEVYKTVWEPLLRGKFGPYADDISAVWFWNKLKLRGGSRGKGGEERLAYFEGGFIALAKIMLEFIKSNNNSELILNSKIKKLTKKNDLWIIESDAPDKKLIAKHVVCTTALPLTANLIQHWAEPEYIEKLNKISYIGNTCLVLELDRSLSSLYWINVNDPTFPFVGVIEHTNFEGPENYQGKHIVYLSKYLPVSDELYKKNKDEFLEYSLPYIKRMFPDFDSSCIVKHHLWKEEWSQPIVVKKYSELIPEKHHPIGGLHLSSMAMIYPEDRGTNYAIREGRAMARELLELI